MMTQENKDLLYKDLCARLPYYVRVNYKGEVYDVLGITNGRLVLCKPFQSHGLEYSPLVEEVKPYLFPLSSMNEEQAKELFNIFGLVCPSTEEDYIKINECTGITFFLNKGFDVETHLDKLMNWLNTNHFDYRGLIEKDLALDATGLNIY